MLEMEPLLSLEQGDLPSQALSMGILIMFFWVRKCNKPTSYHDEEIPHGEGASKIPTTYEKEELLHGTIRTVSNKAIFQLNSIPLLEIY